MPPVYVDPEKLRDFSSKLFTFAQLLDSWTSDLTNQTQKLGETWQDEGFFEFQEQLAKAQEAIKALSEESKQVVPKIQRDADAAEKFLKINLGR